MFVCLATLSGNKPVDLFDALERDQHQGKQPDRKQHGAELLYRWHLHDQKANDHQRQGW